MKKNNYSLFLIILLILPAIFVYQNIILGNNIARGDAPYFYTEALNSLLTEPYLWTVRNASFGGINTFLSLSPLIMLFGVIHKLTNFGSNEILKIIFYFPAIFFSFIGPWYLAKYKKYPLIVQFFSSLIYGLNTYILLVIDGGQVGIALAYGLFPIAILSLFQYINKKSVSSAVAALFVSTFILIADVRIGIIALAVTIIWTKLKNILLLIPLFLVLLGLNLYWILPIVNVGFSSISGIPALKLTSLLNAITLYQPHWPGNQFGKISYPPFYFVFIPLLIVLPLLVKSARIKYSLYPMYAIFIIFSFLVKGETAPAGAVYALFLRYIPFAGSFRDSTKFFAPLLLTASILIGISVSLVIKNLKKRKRLKQIFVLGAYLFILLCINDVFLGKMNYVLQKSNIDTDYKIIAEHLQDDNWKRSVWIPETPNYAYLSDNSEAIDGKELINIHPFASLNTGTDPFNFLNNKISSKWLSVLGVKYLFLSGDTRNLNKTDSEQKNWNEIQKAVAENSDFEKINWGQKITAFKVNNPQPKMFASKKLYIITGPDDITKSLVNVPLVYTEDGKFNPLMLGDYLASDAAVLVMNKKTDLDLQMAALTPSIPALITATGAWEKRAGSEYLNTKYDLLVKGLDTSEFNYGAGLVFSTVPQEKIYLPISIEEDGNARVAIRYIGRGLKYNFQGKEGLLPDNKTNNFRWEILPRMNFTRGVKILEIINTNSMSVINTAFAISDKNWNESLKLINSWKNKFITIYLNDNKSENEFLKNLENEKYQNLDTSKINITRYDVVAPADSHWVIFTDSYNPLWKLKRGIDYFPVLPIYSAVNGFYIDPKWKDTEIIFSGQRYVRWGLYFAAITACLTVIGILFIYAKKYNSSN